MNICIIPARGGSVRIPRKNIRLFHGKPIIAYSIETARESRLFDEIIVSTDHPDIVAVAKGYGAKVHMRPARLCEGHIGTQEVTRAALLWWLTCHPESIPEQVCCIYATAPLMQSTDLILGQGALGQGSEYAYACGMDPVRDAGQWLELVEVRRTGEILRVVEAFLRHHFQRFSGLRSLEVLRSLPGSDLKDTPCPARIPRARCRR